MNSNIEHTNGQIVFARAKKEVQQAIAQGFILPENEPYLYIDNNGLPFVQRPNQARLYCTIRKESLIDSGFHGYSRNN